MNIYELFGGLICPIIVAIFLVLFEIFEKNKIINFIMTILFMFSCLFCIYFNTQIKVNYFNVSVYGLALLGYWYFGIAAYIKRNIDRAEMEIKDKINSCEMNIRLDIEKKSFEEIKEYYSTQESILKAYDKMTNTLIKDTYTRVKENNEEIEKITQELENKEG